MSEGQFLEEPGRRAGISSCQRQIVLSPEATSSDVPFLRLLKTFGL